MGKEPKADLVANSSLRLVVMGTGPFAVPMFRALLAARHTVLALVTQPVRSAVGKAAPPANPMRAVAEEAGLKVLTPESVNTEDARSALLALAPDLFVVADYGQILSSETLAVARLGGVNLHGSLLPKYRGAAPINWAIYHGETEAGVTVIHMTPRIDAGPAIAQARTPIDAEEDAVALEQRLAVLGAPLLAEVVDRLSVRNVEALPQDKSQASPARRLRKTDGEVDWQRGAQQIKNQVRALVPWPKTSTAWLRRHGEPLRLILGRVAVDVNGPEAAAADMTAADMTPGTVLAIDRQRIVVATGDGRLAIEQLQPAGKRMMTVAEFTNGYSLEVGDRFGAVNSITHSSEKRHGVD